jgi:hypothetical protein
MSDMQLHIASSLHFLHIIVLSRQPYRICTRPLISASTHLISLHPLHGIIHNLLNVSSSQFVHISVSKPAMPVLNIVNLHLACPLPRSLVTSLPLLLLLPP